MKKPEKCRVEKSVIANHDAYDFALSIIEGTRLGIDIGAHIGTMTTMMAETFDHVISFEPLWTDYLRQNTSNLSNVTIHGFGLGDREKTEDIFICDRNSGGSTLVRHRNRDWIKGSDKKPIQIKTLDSLSLFAGVDFVKIDVESYEYFTVAGAKQTLLENDCVIMIEYLNRYQHKTHPPTRTHHLLTNLGYRMIKKFGHDSIYKK